MNVSIRRAREDDVEFLVESRPLGRRLTEEGLKVTVTDCTRCDSYVKVDLTPQDLAAVPEKDRASTLLMRKVDYAPVVEAADGGRSRVEVRVMFVWRDGRPLPVTTLARLSQGKMMGVKFNRDKTWVGSTSCLWPRTS